MPSLKLLIIGSRTFKQSTVTMLLEEGKKFFSKVLFVPVHKIRIVLESNETKLYYKDKDLTEFDVIYPRFGAKDFLVGEALLKIIKDTGKYNPVSLKSFQITNHKYYTVKELSKVDVPVVKSSLFISPEAARESIEEFGFPAVVKLLSGFAGKGVILVRDSKQLDSILDTVHLFNEVISAQKFVESKPSDIRCYVIGEKVIAVKRTGRKGEWRANISRGGKAELIDLTNEMKEIALKSAKALEMDISAVDLIETKKGLALIEVNFMPGPFKKFLGNKIPKEIIKFLYTKAVEKNK